MRWEEHRAADGRAQRAGRGAGQRGGPGEHPLERARLERERPGEQTGGATGEQLTAVHLGHGAILAIRATRAERSGSAGPAPFTDSAERGSGPT